MVFSANGALPNNVYIADLYECVSFLGDVNFKIKDLPDGQKIRIVIGKKPKRARRNLLDCTLHQNSRFLVSPGMTNSKENRVLRASAER
jgi:hypothetical protein